VELREFWSSFFADKYTFQVMLGMRIAVVWGAYGLTLAAIQRFSFEI